MDNLTHSLAGALLGQTGLKRLTGRATATLVLAANAPDVDAFAMLLGTEGLAIRRGLTHGPIAMLILPIVVTGLVLAWNRWRPADQPVRAAPLLLLAYIGAVTHPALDFLNSYGIRLLEPFSSRWYAGDTIFIIDIWIWVVLVGCWFWSRRREKRGSDWKRPAWIGAGLLLAYVAANGLITGRAEAVTIAALTQRGADPALVVANPVPMAFWRRNMLWRNSEFHGDARFSLAEPLAFGAGINPNGLEHPALRAARGRSDVEAYLFWSRMPIVIEDRSGRLFLADQRFSGGVRRGQFVVPLGSSR